VKYGKKQEGTNKRCPEGLTTDSGPTAPPGTSLPEVTDERAN